MNTKKILNFHFNIVLCGFMGCGKSTVGHQLALQTGLNLVDTDSYIESEADLSVNQIFSTCGQASFRAHEKNCIKNVATLLGSIISLGGGAILDVENLVNLKKNGKIFFLDAPINVIIARLGANSRASRPLLSNMNSIYELFFSRREKYLQAADFIVGADKSVSSICAEILEIANKC